MVNIPTLLIVICSAFLNSDPPQEGNDEVLDQEKSLNEQIWDHKTGTTVPLSTMNPIDFD